MGSPRARHLIRSAGRVARDRRRQARRRTGQRLGLRPGPVRIDADAVGRGRRARRRRGDDQPSARRRRDRAPDRRGRSRRCRCIRVGADIEPGRLRPLRRSRPRGAAARAGRRSRRLAGIAARRGGRALGPRGRRRCDRAAASGTDPRADARRRSSCFQGSAPRAEARPSWATPSAITEPEPSSRRRARSPGPTTPRPLPPRFANRFGKSLAKRDLTPDRRLDAGTIVAHRSQTGPLPWPPR